MKKTLSFFFVLSFFLASFALAERGPAARVGHARELLGQNRLMGKISKLRNISSRVESTVRRRLPKKHRSQSRRIASTIITEAHRHGLDPYFVMAVIAGESSFNPEAVGPVGEIGLMQIRVSTGKWMANKARVKWRGEKTLKDPITNVKIGTTYLAHLRRSFKNEGQLYLAAYNMGARSVKNALGRKIRPKDYPIHVMKRYIAFYKEN